MALVSGTRIGAYEIVSAVGAGGMGEVYRAKDLKLSRDVAIKVLPAALAQDPERLARFEREAKLLASLNHPNIAHVYGFESALLDDGSSLQFLAMELVEGEDLAARLKRGPIPVDDALAVARQIAEALEEAHDHAIVHRDLKPANVKLTPDGKVKVLDFGLAKAWEGPGAASSDISHSPTLAHSGTAAGLILGTPAYMSPEQARGRTVDKRADIWSFGVVVFEMLTGRPLFGGETVSDVLAGVLKSDVDLAALPEATPFGVRPLLARCLERNPRQRLRDIGEARVALEASIAGAGAGAASALAPPGGPPAWAVPAMVAAAITALVVGLVTWLAARPAEPPAPLVRSTLLLPHVFEFAISATHVVVATRDERLLLRSLDSSAAVPLPGVESGTLPFFSPDGQWIAYFSRGRLRKVATSGGPASDICEVAREGWRLGEVVGTPADWGPGGIVFSDREGRLLVVSPDGGAPRTILQPATGELYLRPRWIGGHRTILFTAAGRQGTGSADTSSARVMALSLEPGAKAVKVVDGRYGHFVPPRALAFVRDNTLVTARFDPATLATSGPIETVEADAPAFAVSPDGALLFQEGPRPDVTYVWLDRQGREEPTGMPEGPYRYPRISPDGSRIVVPSDAGERDLWVWDMRQKALARLTTEKGLDSYPVWTPDGRQIVYAAEIAGGYQNLALRSADGVGAREMLTKSDRHQTPYTISPDGRLVVFRDEVPDQGTNLGVLDLQKREEKPLIATRFNERNAEISPDGRLIAYQSDEAGEYEVFVRPFPNVDAGKKQISSGGGRRPVWSRDGRRLFFEATSAAAAIRVSERKGAGLEFEPAHSVFDEFPFFASSLIGRTYDLGADGRFLMAKRGDQAAEPPGPTLVLNWARHLAANRP